MHLEEFWHRSAVDGKHIRNCACSGASSCYCVLWNRGSEHRAQLPCCPGVDWGLSGVNQAPGRALPLLHLCQAWPGLSKSHGWFLISRKRILGMDLTQLPGFELFASRDPDANFPAAPSCPRAQPNPVSEPPTGFRKAGIELSSAGPGASARSPPGPSSLLSVVRTEQFMEIRWISPAWAQLEVWTESDLPEVGVWFVLRREWTPTSCWPGSGGHGCQEEPGQQPGLHQPCLSRHVFGDVRSGLFLFQPQPSRFLGEADEE